MRRQIPVTVSYFKTGSFLKTFWGGERNGGGTDSETLQVTRTTI